MCSHYNAPNPKSSSSVDDALPVDIGGGGGGCGDDIIILRRINYILYNFRYRN